MFFSFDGVDGVGKSTQIDLFCQWLNQQGHDVVQCRDPGSTSLGEKIRGVLLDDFETPIDIRAEMFLYMTSRAQLVQEIIQPALAENKVIVCDRYLFANVVYQSAGGEIPPDVIWRVGEIATGGLAPNLTFLLDMDPKAASTRMNRELDRIEAKGIDYMCQVRQGFLDQAKHLGDTVSVIDASQSIEEVQRAIQTEARSILANREF